ncbi:MAG: DODA-type extradiol aromatic ring-opening family dioxygenase [Thermodesulfobacteriota bacterium]
MTIPTIFLSHGPPSILLRDDPSVRFWRSLGASMPRPRAVVCISAHWETVRPMLTSNARPGILYDFSGPPPLFSRAYPATGDPKLAESIREALAAAGFDTALDASRGLDHGVWVPVSQMFPQADIPVIQLALQTELSPRHHYALGRSLGPLRDEGVLILGSGGAVHNLDEIHAFAVHDTPPDYALAFEAWLETAISDDDVDALLDYRKQAPSPDRCHPYPAEHLLPLFVCLGAGNRLGPGRRLHQGFLYGVLSMAAYSWP